MNALGRIRSILLFLAALTRFVFAGNEAGLLLHFDFESAAVGQIHDVTGRYPGIASNVVHVPGRVGRVGVAVRPVSSGYVHVRAAGTPLELANSPFTIACWYLS